MIDTFKIQGPNLTNSRRGMTIVEISLTLALLLTMATVTAFSLSGTNDWKKARSASVKLQSVYLAQKSYLADHPTNQINSVAAADLLPYLPNNLAAIPTCESLDGGTLTIDFHVMPPVAMNGTSAYDPSGAADDGLWDVGQL